MKFQHQFKFEGRRYCLKKRRPSQDAAWCISMVYRGQRFPNYSLETNQAAVAVERAKLKIAAWRGGDVAKQDALRVKRVSAKLCECVEVYEAHARTSGRPSAATVRRVVNCLKWCCRLAQPGRAWETILTSELDKGWLRAYEAAVVKMYLEKSPDISTAVQGVKCRATDLTDQERKQALAKAATSGASMLNQARSVFRGAMLEVYEEAGLKLPATLGEWRTGRREALQGKAADYMRPSDELIARTFAAMEGLRGTDPVAWRAWWLCVGTGLRGRSEAVAARWDWWQVVDGTPWLVTDFVGKGGEQITVPVLAQAAERLGPERGEGLILAGDAGVCERLSGAMRALGWETEKTIHEVRKFVGSKIAEQEGVLAAAQFLRHKDGGATLMKHYARYLNLRTVKITLPV